MMRLGICAAMAAALTACGGGDLCTADISMLAGAWQVALTADGDTETATLVIDEDGNTSVTTSDKDDAFDCNVESDDLCALKLRCKERGGNDEFTISLTKTR